MRALALLGLLVSTAAAGGELVDRWFFYFGRNLTADEDVELFERLAATAADNGYNGVCLSGVDAIHRWDAARLGRLERVKPIAADRRLEIIPLIYSVGYGGGALGEDANLAVGFPVEGAVYQVAGDRARHVGEPAPVANPGFEQHEGDRAVGWTFHDKPGEVSFIDSTVRHGGAASLRLENPGARGLGPHARVMQRIRVAPKRQYRVRLWVRGEDLDPAGVRVMVLTTGEPGRTLISQEFGGETFDWRELSVTFNSYTWTEVGLYVGTWGAESGRFWVDDVSVEDAGLVNLIRRESCPVSIMTEDGQPVEEGRDIEPWRDPDLLRGPHDSPPLRLIAGGRLRDGQRLRVSGYHAQRVANGQTSVCMSAPGLYSFFERVAAGLAEHLPASRVLLSMDEIRQAGTDLADRSRGLTLGQILADCLSRQQAILGEQLPGVTCYVWSDMLDPGHNGHGDYYQTDGDFGGAIDGVPRNMVIACWWEEQCERSLRFFDERGFATLGAAYYDADELEGSRRWLRALTATPGSRGIMYTTWRQRYDLLAPFGRLVSAGR